MTHASKELGKKVRRLEAWAREKGVLGARERIAVRHRCKAAVLRELLAEDWARVRALDLDSALWTALERLHESAPRPLTLGELGLSPKQVESLNHAFFKANMRYRLAVVASAPLWEERRLQIFFVTHKEVT